MNPLETIRITNLRHRLVRPFWLLLLGLAVALAAFWAPAEGMTPFVLWFLGLVFSVSAAVISYRWSVPNITETAFGLDKELDAQNRFEAAQELSAHPSPLSAAQLYETEQHVASMEEPASISGFKVVAVLLLLFLNFSMAIGWLIWNRSANDPQEVAVEASPEGLEEPTASLEWVSPDPETTASPLEVLPLTATAESTSGLKDLDLMMSINGVEQPPMPVEVDLHEAGTAEFDIDVYLDLYELQPFDMVAYYLKGQRIFVHELPPTVSELQFVQIRPYRDDVGYAQMPGGEGEMQEALNILKDLKHAQLSLLKQNFLLAHTDQEDPSWEEENQLVGTDQELLAEKTAKAIDFFIEMGAQAVIVDLLGQSKPAMEESATAILAEKNPEALLPQGEALGKLTEVEKYIQKTIMEMMSASSGSAPPPEPEDPFADPDEFHLPPRKETAAGKLEQLVEAQKDLVEGLSGATPEEAAKEQEDVAEKLEELIENEEIPFPVEQSMQAGSEAMEDAQEQLEAGDLTAAREPAVQALLHLEEALNTMKEEAERGARDLLAQTQRNLGDATMDAMPPKEEDPYSEEGEESAGEAEGDHPEGSSGEMAGEELSGEKGDAPGMAGEMPGGLRPEENGEGGSPEEMAGGELPGAPGEEQTPGGSGEPSEVSQGGLSEEMAGGGAPVESGEEQMPGGSGEPSEESQGGQSGEMAGGEQPGESGEGQPPGGSGEPSGESQGGQAGEMAGNQQPGQQGQQGQGQQGQQGQQGNGQGQQGQQGQPGQQPGAEQEGGPGQMAGPAGHGKDGGQPGTGLGGNGPFREGTHHVAGARMLVRNRDALRREALRQQEFGSEKMAEMYADLSNKMDEGIERIEKGEDSGEVMESLFEEATDALVAMEGRREALEMTRATLEQAAMNMERLTLIQTGNQQIDAMEEILSDLLISAHVAQLLIQNIEGEQASKQIWEDMAAPNRIPIRPQWLSAKTPVDKLLRLIDEELSGLTREAMIRLGKPDDAPEAYRDAVSKYFEHLSNPTESTE